MASLALKLLASGLTVACTGAGGVTAEVSVDVNDESKTIGVYKTTASLQVVSNPLLDRTFLLPNGTTIPNPIHKAAWGSLRALGADHVRFQPWFPYPHKAVAEMDAPQDGKPTSWDFTAFMPQMEDFMENTAALGHPVTWNIGTIPCWMFWGPTTNHSHCPYPENAEVSDFGYGTRGFRPIFFNDGSGKQLADYFARVMSYLVNGYMVDEHGVTLSGGPKYNFSAKAGHIFEFLNEGEHYYTADEYVNDYDASVPAIQSALGKDNSPSFMGIGGCHDGYWNWWVMPNCTVWLEKYLNRSHHKVSDVPLDYASIHYYSTTSNRSDVNSYTKGFFGSADKWLPTLDKHITLRDRLSPETKLALTELGILMVDDMSHNFGLDGGLPDMFFNAAAAFLAYTYTHVAIKGIDIACFSQFVGSPIIEKWGIKDMSFPSGSMISWETGFGNAKYWVLKLFIDHVQKGDLIQEMAVVETRVEEATPQQYKCEAVGAWTFNNEITLTCNDPNARIDHIWADMGKTPIGQCGNYKPNQNCSNHLLATAWAGIECLGRRSCTLQKENRVADFAVCPDHTEALLDQRLTLQARCTGDQGIKTSAEYHGDSIFSKAFVSPDTKTRKLLLVNKLEHPVDVKISAAVLGTGGAKAYIVDPKSVSRSSAQGIRQEDWMAPPTFSSLVVTLQPYSVVIAVTEAGASMASPQTAAILI